MDNGKIRNIVFLLAVVMVFNSAFAEDPIYDDLSVQQINSITVDSNEIVVTKPAGGEVWVSGSQHEIKWSSYNAGLIDILFSKNDGNNCSDFESKEEGGLQTLCEACRVCGSQGYAANSHPHLESRRKQTTCLESGRFQRLQIKLLFSTT